MRTFIAVFPPPAVAETLAELISSVRQRHDGVSWVKTENLHYTLRFLGELEEPRVAAASRAAHAAVQGAESFGLTLGGVGGFPNLRRPRVLWIGAEQGGEELETLARSVQVALSRERFGPPDKSFRAHLTVGRVRDFRRAVDGVKRFSSLEVRGEFQVKHVVVVESRLHPRGAMYHPVTKAALGPSGR